MLLDITYLWTLKKYSKQVTDQKASKKKKTKKKKKNLTTTTHTNL